MIRKVITVLLATASCVIGAAWVASWSHRLTGTVYGESSFFEFRIHDGYLQGTYVAVDSDAASRMGTSLASMVNGNRLRSPIGNRLRSPITPPRPTSLFHHGPLPGRGGWGPQVVQGTIFGFALWPLLIVTAPFPTLMIARGTRNAIRYRRRRKRGLCAACGYNLTGNTSGVCPECAERIGPCDDRQVTP